MAQPVKIGSYVVGDGHPCFVAAEIGINHNGKLDIAKKLIDVAALAGCNAVKLQKRTVDVAYSQEELAKPRESPFGATNGDFGACACPGCAGRANPRQVEPEIRSRRRQLGCWLLHRQVRPRRGRSTPGHRSGKALLRSR